MMSQLLQYNDQQIANMQTANDFGSLFGGAVLGVISDSFYHKRSPVAVVCVVVAFILVAIVTIYI